MFLFELQIGSLPTPNLLLSWCLVKCSFLQVLLKLWLIICFQLDQFLHECSVFFVLIGCIHPLCNRSVAVFSHVAPYHFLWFQEGHIPLVFHLSYFLFFFVNIARSCISWMILLAVCTSNFLQAIFLHMVWVLFTAFGTCLSPSTSFPVMFIFLAFEASQGCWDILLNSLKTIADLHFLGSIGRIKYQDVSVGLDLFFAFSNGRSYVCNSLFSQGWCYLLFCSECRLLITPLEVLSFSCR